MLVDRSSRIWAMRRDEMMIADAAQAREIARSEGATSFARGGEQLDGSDFAYVIDGVAVVPVRGMLMRQMSFWFWSYEEIARDVALAQANPNVTSILLDVDSPGGLAAGCGDCAQFLRNSGGKPVNAFVGGMAASAAYYLASAAETITVGSSTMLGSIGTVIEYIDIEPIFEKMGARIVRVVAKDSPNKRLDPDSDAGKAEMQALVDAAGAEFLGDVAAFRGVSLEEARDRFGQGLVFDGMEALSRGMADGRGTLLGTIAELAGRDAMQAVPAPAAMEDPMDWESLSTAQLREHRADIVSDIEAGARQAAEAEAETATKTAIDNAIADERARCAAIDEIAVEGYEELTATAKAEGWSAEKLAMETVKADKKSGKSYLEGRRSDDTAAAVAPAQPPEETHSGDGSVEDRAKAKWDKDANLRSEFGGDFDRFLAFEKASAKGSARILNRSAA